MKNIISVLAVLLVGMTGFAQEDLSTYASAKGTFWSSADTISESESVSYVFRIKGANVMDLQFQLLTTKISGNVTQNIIFSGSNDGTTYTNLDTIANSNASTNTQFLNLDDFNYSYLKVSFTNSATAQSAWFQCWYSFREE